MEFGDQKCDEFVGAIDVNTTRVLDHSFLEMFTPLASNVVRNVENDEVLRELHGGKK